MFRWKSLFIGLLLVGVVSVARLHAQANPFSAPPSAIDTLSEGPVSAPGGAQGLARARQAAQPRRAAGGIGGMSGGMGGGGMAGLRNQARGGPARGRNQSAAAEVVERIIKPRIKVIKGSRVYDKVTGELLDDAQLAMVDESEKGNYFDDGINGGDQTEGDGLYSLVDVRRDVIGQSNQRIKERLIQAIYQADALEPLEFYGFSIMSTSKRESVPRSRRWKIVRSDEGGRRF